MKTIIEMMLLGLVAGLIVSFWTRIIKEGVIFSFVGDWLNNLDNKAILNTGTWASSPIADFFRCVYCLTPWFVFLLSTVYILAFHPVWYLAIIGGFGALGSGNFICEIIYLIRK